MLHLADTNPIPSTISLPLLVCLSLSTKIVMANLKWVSSLLTLLLLGGNIASATVFNFKNHCTFPVWPGAIPNNGSPALGDNSGFAMQPGETKSITTPPNWSGRFWGRTSCTFDASGNGHCVTGDCNSKLKCKVSGNTPATLAEITVTSGHDTYDVSLVDGFNIGVGMQPIGKKNGDCKYTSCPADVNGNCPQQLQVTDSGKVVGCKSGCVAFNTPEYCCTGVHNTPQTCPPTNYSKIFSNLCPKAYSYAYDDLRGTFTCSGSDYTITFCPSQ